MSRMHSAIEIQVRSNLSSQEVVVVKNPIVSGFKTQVLRFLMRLHLIKIAAKAYNNPIDWLRAFHYLIALRRRFLGNYKLKKIVKVRNRFYMGIYIPAWFSSGFEDFVLSELNTYKKVSPKVKRFNIVYLAITSKCPMQCEHCYEWDRLNQKDKLTIDRMDEIIGKIVQMGTNQIHFTGGEPLMKFEKLIHAIQRVPNSIASWVTTSGYSLTYDKAVQLKHAGLTGIIVSLDHYEENKHNAFRNHDDAYYWAIEAVKNSWKSGLVVALSICITRDFANEIDLINYLQLAKELGVSFVQFLEPKPIGHYKDKDVVLNKKELKLLESFFLNLNYNPKYHDFPVINYHGFYQRRVGCQSAGLQSVYIDADGGLNACPFCQKKWGNILDDQFEAQLDALTSSGCSSFKNIFKNTKLLSPAEVNN